MKCEWNGLVKFEAYIIHSKSEPKLLFADESKQKKMRFPFMDKGHI